MKGHSDFDIWPPYEAFYIQAMMFNTRSAVESIEQVSTSVKKISQDTSGDPLGHLDTNQLLNELQNIIVQAAALSRYFWPVRQGHEARAKRLRATLCVADDNALRNRDLRNEIEHFDEKLDVYLSEGIAGYIFPEFVGPLPGSEGVPAHVFRAYYLDAGLFEMLGKRYELEPIGNEILRIHDLLIFCDSHGGRLKPQQATSPNV